MLEKMRNSLQLTSDELINKVTWPTWDELQSSAVVVLVASLLIALMVFGMDSIMEFVFKNFYTITK